MAGPGANFSASTSRSSVEAKDAPDKSRPPIIRTCCASTGTAMHPSRAEPIDGPAANAMVRMSRISVV
eukprot:CAMPEP_0184190538 /NCGR_PEP_ID=MMETSP0976-20121227/2519_1 /TAXON_ID=483370 /ORGANISM="non described non described, Strain CCMP2097" /LENGTH=67 /DNA_ID=CAMNT_0026494921 /DNA_START=414 /DNA_END=614 /DNA_ORIENTATION=+